VSDKPTSCNAIKSPPLPPPGYARFLCTDNYVSSHMSTHERLISTIRHLCLCRCKIKTVVLLYAFMMHSRDGDVRTAQHLSGYAADLNKQNLCSLACIAVNSHLFTAGTRLKHR